MSAHEPETPAPIIRVVTCPYFNTAPVAAPEMAPTPCANVLTVTLSPSEEPAVLAVTGCEHVSEDTAAVILPRLRSNGYVVRVDITDHRCPWCDGTGRYACTSHDRVPCGYCHATGQRTEPVERVAIGRGLWTEWGKEANPVTLGPLAA